MCQAALRIGGDEGENLTFEKIWEVDGSKDKDQERVQKAVEHTLKSDPAYVQYLANKKPKAYTPKSAAEVITKQILDKLAKKPLTLSCAKLSPCSFVSSVQPAPGFPDDAAALS